MIYLDNAATSFLKPLSVYHAVHRAMLSAANAGRGDHQTAMTAARIVYDCREAAAALFHMNDPSRVVFTMNATHALNIAIRSLAGKGCKTLISGFEHNAVTRPLHAVGADVRIVGRSLFDTDAVLREFRRSIGGAQLVVCTHVSNVFGFVLPIDEIAALCREHGVPLIVDASQSAGVMELDAERLGAAFIAMPGHKSLFGPQGTGLLLCGGSAEPLLYGGTGSDSALITMPEQLPERLEAGTMNIPGIAGLLAGLRFVLERGTDAIRSEESALIRLASDRLQSSRRLQLFRDPSGASCGILSFQPSQTDSESFSEALSARGIAVRGGLHCAPTAHESAGTLEEGTVRISVSPFVSREQLLCACQTVLDLAED